MKLNLRTSGWNLMGLVWLIGALTVLWVSGVLLELSEESIVPSLSSWTHTCVALHGIAAWVMALIGGRYAWSHVALCWHRPACGTHRNSGWVTLILLIALGVSGILLMYGLAEWRERTSALHWGLGLPIPLLLMAHIISRQSSAELTPASRRKT